MSEKMRAIAVTAVDKVEIIECDKPTISAYELLVRIKATSLCTVEQRTFRGVKKFGFPFVGGHEGYGEVAAVGDRVENFKVGDKVVFNMLYCGQCDACKSGNSTQCENLRYLTPPLDIEGAVLGGALAEYVRVSYVCAHKVLGDVKPEYAALTEPVSCCLHSVNKAKIRMGDTAVVIGGGIMGMCQIQLCKLRGARVILSEPMAERREKSLAVGADLVVDPLAEDPVEFVKNAIDGRGAEVVINTTPITAVWQQAMDMLAPKGRLLAYSSQHPDVPVPISFGRLHSKEYELIGTVNPGAEDFVQAVRLIRYGMLNMDALIECTYDFEDAQEAFEKASQPNTYRVVIRQK